MSIVEKFMSMEYGPAPEDPREAVVWLERHGRLLQHSPQLRLSASAARSEEFAGRLRRAVGARVLHAVQRLALAQRALDTVSPLATRSQRTLFPLGGRATAGVWL